MSADQGSTSIALSNNIFAIELYRRLGQTEGNLFFSPLSISTAMGMIYAGARGQTAKEIARTLHFLLASDEFQPVFRQLLSEIDDRNSSPASPGDIQLVSVNSLWHQSDEPICPDFQRQIDTNYGSALRPVDFRLDRQRARCVINAWVEEQTRGKIEDLLETAHLSPTTRLVLANAIYFKAPWKSPFPERTTASADFFAPNQEHVRVDLMDQTASFRYYDEPSLQVLELPYSGNALSMVIFLPRAVDGLAAFESWLDWSKLQASLTKMSAARVRVSLPRFKLHDSFELTKGLTDLGMHAAFDPNWADFSGITGKRDLAISAVVHQAYVHVEERGTEAAAATAVVAARHAMMAAMPQVFRADHPFFFLIRDNATECVLFLGRVVNP